MMQQKIYDWLSPKHFGIVVLLLIPLFLQASRSDSLRQSISQSRNEFDRLHAMSLLAVELMPDSMARAGELLMIAAPIVEGGSLIQVANYHNSMGVFHWYSGNRQEAITSFKKTLALPVNPSMIDARAMAANNTGTLYRMIGEIDSAKVHLQYALEIDMQRNFARGIAKTQYDLASLYDQSSQYHLALKYILDAVKSQQETADTIALIHSYNVMANIYSRFDSTSKAIYFYNKGLELAVIKEKDKHMITYLNNLVSINAELPDSLANNLSNFQRGVLLATKYDDYRNLLALHGNMARAYDAASKPDMALSFYQIGLDYLDKADNNEVKAGFLSYYGKHLLRNGQIKLASSYLTKALDFAVSSGEASTQMSVYRTLASIDSINGNYLDAMRNLQRSFTLRDSLYNLKKSASITEAQLLYNIQQYENKLSELESENRFSRLRYRFSFAVGLSAILLLGLSMFFFRKHKIIADNKLKIHELTNSTLKIQYESNRQELTGKAMALMNSERLIKKLQDNLKTFLDQADDDCRHKLQPVIREFHTEDKSKELWHDFENRFNELSDGFISKLTAAHPDLSPAEIHLCAMLRLQIPSKEISRLSQRSLRTIEQSRFKIRKKIGLKPGDNLVSYLLNL